MHCRKNSKCLSFGSAYGSEGTISWKCTNRVWKYQDKKNQTRRLSYVDGLIGSGCWLLGNIECFSGKLWSLIPLEPYWIIQRILDSRKSHTRFGQRHMKNIRSHQVNRQHWWSLELHTYFQAEAVNWVKFKRLVHRLIENIGGIASGGWRTPLFDAALIPIIIEWWIKTRTEEVGEQLGTYPP